MRVGSGAGCWLGDRAAKIQAPATVGEELLQHLIVHLEEFDWVVGERVGKLKRGYSWLGRLEP